MNRISEPTRESLRRHGSLVMMVVGWAGMEAWCIWALIVSLQNELPRIPGTLPSWTGPIGIQCLLLAVIGTMVRSRMRDTEKTVGTIKAVARLARDRQNAEKPPTDRGQ